ncbi:MAG: MoaD/ThiS family protein [Candidatus Omnitrophica bacterium]|nr:MoaD/ThiS family protein [Candidatus Omnitrophota bacterium]MCB9722135.1 MoaD/ThiS family protein [Candidatus Omnitrophota bacterium]
MMKTIRIQYFARLREDRGQSEEEWSTDCRSVKELYAQLQAAHGLSLAPASVRPAVNGAYTTWETELNDRDEVVFIPPVAGG